MKHIKSTDLKRSMQFAPVKVSPYGHGWRRLLRAFGIVMLWIVAVAIGIVVAHVGTGQ